MLELKKVFRAVFFCFYLIVTGVFGQSNYYFVVETKTAEDGPGILQHQATYTVSFFNDVIQSFYEDEESSEYRYYSKDTVYIHYKNKTGKEITGLGTTAEMKKYLNSQIDYKHKNIKTEMTGKSEVIVGLLCNEALVSYEYKYVGVAVKFENLVWFSSETKVNDELITADLTTIWVKNNYIDSLKKLNGFIVKQTIKRDNELLATMEVKEFEKLEHDKLKPLYFKLKLKKTKKLKACLREIEGYRKRKDSFERLNPPQK